MAALDEDGHLAIEERQQQGPDVRTIDIGVGVVATDAAHAGDEILVAFHGEIVDIAVARRHLFDPVDRQRHQVTVDHLEILLRAGLCGSQEGVEPGGAGMVLPHIPQDAQVLLGRDADDPTAVPGVAGLTVRCAKRAVGLLFRQRGYDTRRTQRVSDAAGDVVR